MKTKLYFFLAILLVLPFFGVAQTVFGEAFNVTDPDQSHVLLTQNGDQFLGKVLFIRDDTIGFRLRNLPDTLHFLFPEVVFVGSSEQIQITLSQQPTHLTYPEESSKGRKPDMPMPTNNLLYSASAFPFEGRGAYRNTMVLINFVDRQFSPHFTVGGGFFLPAFLTARAQLKKSLSDFVHIGAAFQVYQILVDEQRSSHPYAIVTIGDKKKYLNFTYGYWIDKFGFSDFRDTYQMVTFGGSFAFSENWRFYAEAAAVYQTNESLVLPSFNFSNHRRRSTFEFGLLAIPSSDFPLLPLLNYYYSF